jgi:ribosomal protein L21E
MFLQKLNMNKMLLNGIWTIHELEPKSGLNTHIVLLGEQHDLKPYKKCDKYDKYCFDFIKDFIELIDTEFANRIPTEMYTESYCNDNVCMQGLKYFQNKITASITANKYPLNRKTKGTLRNSQDLYLPCFINQRHENCPTRNIRWVHSDLRCMDTFFGSNDKWHDFRKLVRYLYQKQNRNKDIIQPEDIDVDFDDDEMFTSYLTKDQIEYIVEDSRYLNSNAKYIDYIQNVLLLLFDTPATIDTMLEIPCVAKLYSQVDHSLYTKKSFVQLFEGYKNSVWGKDLQRDCKRVLHQLIRYFETNDLTILTDMKWHDLLFNIIEYWSTLCLAGLLDVYFILSLAVNPLERYVFTLFGSNHCDHIVDYYVNIVKTHTLTYHNQDNKARILINMRTIPVGSNVVIDVGKYKGSTGKVVRVSNDKYTVEFTDHKTLQTKESVFQRTHISSMDTDFRDTPKRSRRSTVRPTRPPTYVTRRSTRRIKSTA